MRELQETWVWSLGSIPGFDPWSRRFPGEGTGNPLQYSCLEKSPRTEEPGGLQSTGWQSRTQLSDSHTPGGPDLCFPVCGTIQEPGLRDHPFDVHHLCSRPQVPSGLTGAGGGAVGADGHLLTAPPTTAAFSL